MVRVKPGETLGHFADWLEVQTSRLRALNGLKYGKNIHIGQKIKLSFDAVAAERFYKRRAAFHQRIEEEFFRQFKVTDVQIRRIKPKENIWSICDNADGLPYWLVLKYNPDLNLDRLRAKDEIIIPVLKSITTSGINSQTSGS